MYRHVFDKKQIEIDLKKIKYFFFHILAIQTVRELFLLQDLEQHIQVSILNNQPAFQT